MQQIPVYVFTGFLDSGKTKFIQETLEDPRFNAGERTLLLLCEEGEEEYDLSTYPSKHVYLEILDDPDAITPELLDGLRDRGFELYVLLNPPKVASSWIPKYTTNQDFGNRLIDAFVTQLTARLEQSGYAYIDTHTALSNEKGYLPDDWCRDGYVHINDTASAVLLDTVCEYLK